MADFEEDCKAGYKNGFAGRLLINPKQVSVANNAYLPDDDQVEYAQRIIVAVEDANQSGVSGVAMLNGRMVGPPMLKRANNILKQVKMSRENK